MSSSSSTLDSHIPRGSRLVSSRAEAIAEKKKLAEAGAQKKAEEETATAAVKRQARKRSIAEPKAKNSKGKKSKTTTQETTPPKPKPNRKRKSPTPEPDSDTDVDYQLGEPAPKKSRSSDEADAEPAIIPKKGRGRPKKSESTKTTSKKEQTELSATMRELIEIGYDSIMDRFAAEIDHHIAAAFDNAVQPYFAMLEILLDFTQTCAKLNGVDEEKTNESKTAVRSLIEMLDKKIREGELFNEDDEWMSDLPLSA